MESLIERQTSGLSPPCSRAWTPDCYVLQSHSPLYKALFNKSSNHHKENKTKKRNTLFLIFFAIGSDLVNFVLFIAAIPVLMLCFCRLLLGEFHPYGPTGPLIIVIICFFDLSEYYGRDIL